jgi:hypothetical protein
MRGVMGRVAVGLVVFLFTALNVSARPADDSWKLVHTSGEVWISSDAVAGELLAPETAVTTGHDGRALLVRGRAAMLIGPGTSLTLDGLGGWVVEQGGRYVGEKERNGDVVVAPAGTSPRFGLDVAELAAVVKA